MNQIEDKINSLWGTCCHVLDEQHVTIAVRPVRLFVEKNLDEDVSFCMELEHDGLDIEEQIWFKGRLKEQILELTQIKVKVVFV